MTLFIITAILLLLTFLLIPTPSQEVNKYSRGDFSFPDNSDDRPVPKLYGRAKFSGNIIYFGDVNTHNIRVCS